MLTYDNTLKIKHEAEAIEKSGLLDKILIGKQKQEYNIGENVNANGIENAIITDAYNQNGFWYYEISWRRGKKTYTNRQRQQDLKTA